MIARLPRSCELLASAGEAAGAEEPIARLPRSCELLASAGEAAGAEEPLESEHSALAALKRGKPVMGYIASPGVDCTPRQGLRLCVADVISVDLSVHHPSALGYFAERSLYIREESFLAFSRWLPLVAANL